MKFVFLMLFESAGHCPHDELPEEVNSIIRQWIFSIESRILTGSIL